MEGCGQRREAVLTGTLWCLLWDETVGTRTELGFQGLVQAGSGFWTSFEGGAYGIG
jgi:hypothetical protein